MLVHKSAEKIKFSGSIVFPMYSAVEFMPFSGLFVCACVVATLTTVLQD